MLLDLRGDVEEALGAQEVAGRSAGGCPGPAAAQRAEVRLGSAGREVEVARSALGVEAGRDRDRLDERRLAAAVLADEEGDARIEIERALLFERTDGRDGERVPMAVRVPLGADLDGAQERFVAGRHRAGSGSEDGEL